MFWISIFRDGVPWVGEFLLGTSQWGMEWYVNKYASMIPYTKSKVEDTTCGYINFLWHPNRVDLYSSSESCFCFCQVGVVFQKELQNPRFLSFLTERTLCTISLFLNIIIIRLLLDFYILRDFSRSPYADLLRKLCSLWILIQLICWTFTAIFPPFWNFMEYTPQLCVSCGCLPF